MPGVSEVSGFDTFFKNVDGYSDELGHFTAYQPGGSGQPGRVLLPLGGNLYDIGLDGKPPRTVLMSDGELRYTCFDRPSVAPSGRWLLCSTTAGIIALDLQISSADNVQLALANQNHPELPAFGPDGRRFVVKLFADKDCELGVFSSEPPYKGSRLVTHLLFPDLVPPALASTTGFGDACDMSDVGWSPDGNWITFIAGRPRAQVERHLYALDLHTVALPSDAASDPAKVITISASTVNDFGAVIGVGDVAPNLTWPQAFDTVSMPAGNQIININLRTNGRRVILSVEDAQFCAASWTPDGAQLFFALCRPYPSNPDTGGPPAQLYLSTP
jgi:WD40-like Beta Propeller Repeat